MSWPFFFFAEIVRLVQGRVSMFIYAADKREGVGNELSRVIASLIQIATQVQLLSPKSFFRMKYPQDRSLQR